MSAASTYPTDAEAKAQIIEAGLKIYQRGLVAANDGNLSVRVGENARVGASPEAAPPEEWGITVVGPEAQVEAGRTLKANRMLNREGKETVR